MLQCSNCGSNQDAGNFCGSCGGALVEVSSKDEVFQEEGIQTEQDVSPNESSEVEQPQPVQQAEQVPYQQALNETAATQVQTSTSPNDIVKQIVGVSKGFGTYFTEYIKGPSRIFSKRESECGKIGRAHV